MAKQKTSPYRLRSTVIFPDDIAAAVKMERATPDDGVIRLPSDYGDHLRDCGLALPADDEKEAAADKAAAEKAAADKAADEQAAADLLNGQSGA